RQAQKGRHKQPKPLPPHEFLSSDGFVIQAGRNNLQNDALTLRQAAKDDIWFHTKEIPGSHVILRADGREVSDTAVYEAALLAAHYSKGEGSSNEPADYTQVRNERQPAGAKPGRGIYEHYRTVYVTPSPEAVEPLEERREQA
ncbi:MAG: NFACT RNA binding domain-containing protein, partial [Clostridiales bacterium]|nr:NFACT RNA binding domain-containing protein [Clostridiales bacterium]